MSFFSTMNMYSTSKMQLSDTKEYQDFLQLFTGKSKTRETSKLRTIFWGHILNSTQFLFFFEFLRGMHLVLKKVLLLQDHSAHRHTFIHPLIIIIIYQYDLHPWRTTCIEANDIYTYMAPFFFF